MLGFVFELIPAAGILGRSYLPLVVALGRNGKMKAHGVMYAWLVAFLFSLFQPSYADVGNLLPIQGLRQDFTDTSNEWQWYTGSYVLCQSQAWLLLDKNLATTGIKEVKAEVEFRIRSSSTTREQLHNKTMFSIAVITSNDGYDVSTAMGTPSRSSDQKLKAIKLLKLHSEQARIGIKSLDDQNCLIIYFINITYNFCPEKTVNNVSHFPRTHSPKNGLSAVKVEGSCSFSNGRRVAYCESSGNWWFNETVPCPCGPGSIATASGCVKLTRTIQDIKAIRQSKTHALLLWRRQAIPTIEYKVECKKCLGRQCDVNCSGVVFHVWPDDSKKHGCIVSGLEQGSRYRFNVFAWIVHSVNGSKNQESWNRSVILKELPSQVEDLKFTSQSPNQIVLSWQPSSNWPRDNVSYNVTCKVYCSQENCSQRCTQLKFTPSRDNLLQTNVTVSGFGQQRNIYLFKIFAKDRWHKFSEDGSVEWNFIGINFTESKKKIPVSESNTFNVVDVIIGVSVLILAVIVTVIVTRCYNRWKARKHSMAMDPENLEHPYEGSVPLTTITSTTHYVDPSNYDSVKNMLHQFTKQLNEKNLKTEEMIGEGEFGVVWRGYLDLPVKEQVTVAVKCLRAGLSAKLRRDFLAEASVMGQFEDPNVISLHGVVIKKNTVKIVMEYMSNGSLDKYLVSNNGRITTLQLLGMARGIASGMQYLSGRNFIHRDLAARNILVDENLSCKVSDFGLTREICQTSNYETRGGKIPIRWTAPEVIKHKKSFIASDVWSYGVVLWEIMSFGQRPYWEWDNFQVLQEIESGYRLPAPLKCPKSVHSLMLDCWQKERTLRPLFSYIVDKLDEWIRSPETVSDSPSIVQKRNKLEDIESPIQHWLDSIKMGKYASNFNKAGYNRLSQLSSLTEDNLLKMEITLVGHRHKIHQSIPLVAKRL